MASKKEIEESVKIARKNGASKIVLLKCSSNYPAQPEDLNLRTMHQMKKKFKCEIGFSDHTLGIGSSLAAISLGARVIEKHFTLTKKLKQLTPLFHEPKEMKLLVENSKIAWQSLGKISYSLSKGELNSKKFKRSLYFIKKMKKNETISHFIRAIRPGLVCPQNIIIN